MNAGSRSLAARRSLGPLALFILALLASACSARRAAGHGRTVSRAGSTTTTHASTSQASGSGNITTANYRAAFGVRRLHALARRAELPGPSSKGALNVNSQTDGKGGSPVSSGVNRNSPQYPRTRSGSARARHGRGRPVRSGARRSDRTTSGAPGEHPM